MTFRIFQSIAAVPALVLIAGCAVVSQTEGPDDSDGTDTPRPIDRPEPGDMGDAPVPILARTVDEFDTTTNEQRSAATAADPAGAETALGVTVASLGSPSEAGFWLKTPLVSSPAQGRVLYAGTGKSVAVELIPLDGPSTAGSQLSLTAMRLIEAPLTGLPEIRVFRISE